MSVMDLHYTEPTIEIETMELGTENAGRFNNQKKKKNRGNETKDENGKEKSSFSDKVLSKVMLTRGADAWMTGAILLLMLGGIIMVISTNLGNTVGDPKQLYMVVLKQIVFMIFGYFIYWFIERFFSYERFESLSMPMFIIFTIVMGLVLVIGQEISGAKSWIFIGPISIQPSEFGKPLLIAFFAQAVYRSRKKKSLRRSFMDLFGAPLFEAMVIIGLVVLQKDIGTAVIMTGIVLTCVLIPDYKKIRKTQKRLKIAAALILALGIGAVSTGALDSLLSHASFLSHISTRISNMKNPYLDVYGEGYQPANSLYAIGDAGWAGKGLGNSARKYGYLTQADSDYILAVVIEETGIIGLIFIVSLYGFILYRLFYFAMKARHTDDKVILGGVAAYMGLHFFVNVGGVACLIPMTGVPLLFISAGGSSVMAVCAALGLAQNRIREIQLETWEANRKNKKRRLKRI